MARKCLYVPKRFIWAFLGHVGFFIVYATQVNLNYAFKRMVNCTFGDMDGLVAGEGRNVSACNAKDDTEDDFNWGEDQQKLLLNAFFIGYIVTQLPGGWAANKYGGKRLITIGVLFASVLTLLSPLAAKQSVYLFIVLRIFQGLGLGVTYPSMHAMVAKWVPPSERTRTVSFIYSGACTGTLFSVLLNYESLWKWSSTFYLLGGIGVAWCALWVIFVTNSPENHTTISLEERNYIVNTQESSAFNTRFARVPWYRIFSSTRVWAIIVAHFSHNWVWYLLLNRLPSYYKDVLNFSTEENRLLTSLSFLVGLLAFVVSGFVADHLIKNKSLSTLRTRRLMNMLAFYPTALLLVLESYITDDQVYASATFMILSTAFLCLNSPVYVNHVDIAPRFAGVVMALTNIPATVSAYVSPMLSDYFTHENPTRDNYRKVFLIAAGVAVVGSTFFNTFASGKHQRWNELPEISNKVNGYSNTCAESSEDSDTDTNDESNKKVVIELEITPSVWI